MAPHSTQHADGVQPSRAWAPLSIDSCFTVFESRGPSGSPNMVHQTNQHIPRPPLRLALRVILLLVAVSAVANAAQVRREGGVRAGGTGSTPLLWDGVAADWVGLGLGCFPGMHRGQRISPGSVTPPPPQPHSAAAPRSNAPSPLPPCCCRCRCRCSQHPARHHHASRPHRSLRPRSTLPPRAPPPQRRPPPRNPPPHRAPNLLSHKSCPLR